MNPIIEELLSRSDTLVTIHGVQQDAWMRDTEDRRRGPWKTLDYAIKDAHTYKQPGACLYFVIGPDAAVRYVGKTTGRFDTRWRLARALHPVTGQVLSQRKLFHSECMKYLVPEIENHHSFNGVHLLDGNHYIVKRIFASKIRETIRKVFPESVAWTDKDVVEKTESWMCKQQVTGFDGVNFLPWNIALTTRSSNSRPAKE